MRCFNDAIAEGNIMTPELKVGDMVLVNPAKGLPCIVVSMQANNEAGILPKCVTLYVLEHGYTLPMNKKWIEVLSSA